MRGCWEANLKLREAQRLFQDQLQGPESLANIGGESSWNQFQLVLLHSDTSGLHLQTSCTLEQLTEGS